jgi:hypothetical protein
MLRLQMSTGSGPVLHFGLFPKARSRCDAQVVMRDRSTGTPRGFG